MNGPELLRRIIPPMPAAEQAERAESDEQRDLILWLQGKSIERGVGAVAAALLDLLPGVATVSRNGYSNRPKEKRAANVEQIARELLHFCGSSHDGYQFESVRIPRGALIELRKRHDEQLRARYVETSVGRVVSQALESALRLHRLICIEGEPGFGKSYAAKIWASLHCDRVRYVRLPGITNRQGFFFSVLERLGFSQIEHSGADKLQRMLQHYLRSARLMLIIDEAQNLLPAKECSKKRPELLDWIAGETYDEGIPCALLTWDDFAKRRALAEEQTHWKATHLSRRIQRYERLVTPPTEDDFRALAAAMVPKASADTLDMLVGYAISSKHYVSGLVEIIAEANDVANQRGGKLNFADVEAAITRRSVSDAAQVEALTASLRVLETPLASRGGLQPIAPAPRRNCGNMAALLPERGSTPVTAPHTRATTPEVTL